MKFGCENCGAKYSIADQKVAGRVFKLRCKKCGERMEIRGASPDVTAPSPFLEPTRPYYLCTESEPVGPFHVEEVVTRLNRGELAWDALVWSDGFDDWQVAQECEELLRASNSELPGVTSSTDHGALTGTRNENSVLFSLSNLQALADHRTQSSSTDRLSGGSGLIDIRRLAKEAARSENAPVAGSLPTFDPALPNRAISPVPPVMLAESGKRSHRGLWIGATGVGVSLLSAAAAILVIVTTSVPHTPQAEDAPTLRPTSPAPPPVGAEGGQDTPSAAASATGAAVTPSAVEADAHRVQTQRLVPRAPRSPSHRPESASPRERERAPVARATSEPTHPSGDLDDMVRELVGPAENTRRPHRSVPDTPSRTAVRGALDSVASAVGACGSGQGNVTVRVVFTGRTGRVHQTRVTSAGLPSPVRSCVVRAVGGAHVPEFGRDRFSVAYAYRL